MHVHPFSSVVLIPSNTEQLELTVWMHDVPILVSGFYQLKNRRLTHSLNACSPILVSGSHSLKHQRARVTHCLNVCLPILVSGSDLFKHWRVTHSLDGGVYPFLSVVPSLILSYKQE